MAELPKGSAMSSFASQFKFRRSLAVTIGVVIPTSAHEQCGSWDNRFGIECPPASILTVWDADADGPLPPQLIAGGSFRSFGKVDNIARWDGTEWRTTGIPRLTFGKSGNLHDATS